MISLCRECGKAAAPEYADEHDGLCMTCVHRDQLTLFDEAPQADDPIRDAIDRACVDLFGGKP